LDYLSTAYVASSSTGIVLEDDHLVAPSHNNPYEQSKYEAEILVRKAMRDLPVAILRPSIVTSDLRTGYAPATGAFYRLLHGLARGTLQVIPGRPETLLDLVPLDYVAGAAFVIGCNPEMTGRCFHLSAGAENLITLGDLRDLSCAAFGRDVVQILPPEEFRRWVRDRRRALPAQSSFFDEMELYLPYLSHHSLFDTRNTKEALRGTGIEMVPIQAYFDTVASYVAGRAKRTGESRG
jgi:long-chain acyl-CoA synthetase